ncbi:uncharacterized protein FFE2_08575 [Fusarium fujikuroi]|nr:uncharacterized protein FFE2_08575 [Fusarium fujikuroi]
MTPPNKTTAAADGFGNVSRLPTDQAKHRPRALWPSESPRRDKFRLTDIPYCMETLQEVDGPPDEIARADSPKLNHLLMGGIDNTRDNTSGYKISAIISDPAEAVAIYNKVVKATGCTTVIAELIPACDDEGIDQSETDTVSVDAVNLSNVSDVYHGGKDIMMLIELVESGDGMGTYKWTMARVEVTFHGSISVVTGSVKFRLQEFERRKEADVTYDTDKSL